MNWNTWIPQEQSLFLCQRISTSIRVRINPVRSGRGPNGSCIFNGFPLDENHWAGTGVLHVGSIPAQLYIYLTQTPITMHRDTSRFQRGADGLSLNVFLSSRIISFYSDYHIDFNAGGNGICAYNDSIAYRWSQVLLWTEKTMSYSAPLWFLHMKPMIESSTRIQMLRRAGVTISVIMRILTKAK